MLEDGIIKRIIDAWSTYQEDRYRDIAQKPLLSFGHVKCAVEQAFLASLRREEEKPLNFVLVLATPHEVECGANELYSLDHVLHLQSPLPLSANSIAKISPAFDPRLSALAVEPTEVEHELEIWGVFTFSPPKHRFNEIPVAIQGELAHRPDMFTIYVNGPGALRIARSNSQIGRFINGEFCEATPTAFTSNSLGHYLIETVKSHELYQEFKNEYWIFFRDALEHLLAEASDRGHGSTIVLLNASSLETGSKYFTSRFQFLEQLGIRRLLKAAVENDRDIAFGIARRKLILERLGVLAQLSVIDGALVLTSELDLIAFGAKLSAPKWSKTVVTGPDGFGKGGGEQFDYHRLGTRHNSAIDFAGNCAESTVFVISQDGPVRAFIRNDEQTVLCWPDCSESMFI